MPEKQVLEKPIKVSFLTRAFGHFMDLYGPHLGSWILGVFHLDKCPTREEFRDELILKRLFKMSRFRSVMKVSKSTAYFQPIPVEEIDLSYHLVYPFEDKEISEKEMLDYLGRFFETEILLDKPLWKFLVFPKLDNGKAAFVFVNNHAIGDGVSDIGALLQILDDSPIDPNLPLNKQPKQETGKNEDKGFIIQKRENKPASLSVFTRSRMFLYGIWKGATGFLGGDDPDNILKMNFTGKDFFTEFKGIKKLCQSDPISLNEIKTLKNNLAGGTVNDVIMTILTLTVKAYMDEKGQNVTYLRGQFPVSLRGRDEAMLTNGNPNNRWQNVMFRYPFEATADPVECFWKVKDQLDKLKVSPQVFVQNSAQKTAARILPRKNIVEIGLQANMKASTQLSNVPGPQKKVHILGSALEDMSFYFFGTFGVFLGVLTYDGNVSLSINVDSSIDVDPEDINKHWKEQYLRLKGAVMKFTDVIPQSKKARKKLRLAWKSDPGEPSL